MKGPEKIFLIAGEASGDVLGASLMADMKTIAPFALQFSGVGGPLMAAEGLASLFPITDLSIMGLAEVLRHLPLLRRRLDETVAAILAQNPDILLTIDAPDFCLRVAKRVKRARPAIRIIHYVAPTVWAWRAGRAKKIARFLDGLLCLFPFEPRYFQRHGLKAEFVGHSLTRIVLQVTDAVKSDFCAAHGLDPSRPTLCLLPGSRLREISALLPLMREVVARLRLAYPDLQFVLPTLPHLLDPVTAGIGAQVSVFAPQSPDEKYAAFATSTLALHASGTVALELALCNTPMVTIYKISPMTAFIARFLLRTKFANLVNILLRYHAVPELLQQDATVDKIMAAIAGLLDNPAALALQKAQLAQVEEHLQENAPFSAARFVLRI